jgi:hypothetical protein
MESVEFETPIQNKVLFENYQLSKPPGNKILKLLTVKKTQRLSRRAMAAKREYTGGIVQARS